MVVVAVVAVVGVAAAAARRAEMVEMVVGNCGRARRPADRGPRRRRHVTARRALSVMLRLAPRPAPRGGCPRGHGPGASPRGRVAPARGTASVQVRPPARAVSPAPRSAVGPFFSAKGALRHIGSCGRSPRMDGLPHKKDTGC